MCQRARRCGLRVAPMTRTLPTRAVAAAMLRWRRLSRLRRGGAEGPRALQLLRVLSWREHGQHGRSRRLAAVSARSAGTLRSIGEQRPARHARLGLGSQAGGSPSDLELRDHRALSSIRSRDLAATVPVNHDEHHGRARPRCAGPGCRASHRAVSRRSESRPCRASIPRANSPPLRGVKNRPAVPAALTKAPLPVPGIEGSRRFVAGTRPPSVSLARLTNRPAARARRGAALRCASLRALRTCRIVTPATRHARSRAA